MDSLKNLVGGGSSNKDTTQQPATTQKKESSGGIMDSLNTMAGGGKKSEQNEDALDKGTSFIVSCPLLPAGVHYVEVIFFGSVINISFSNI